MSSKSPIIIDLGSSEVKAGFKTDGASPSIRFPSYIGEAKYNKILRVLNKNKSYYKDQFIGNDCDPYLGVVKLRYPIKYGSFSNEEDISLIFNHIFSKLRLNEDQVSDHPLLISEPILNPKENRDMISELLFEKYKVPSLIFGFQPSLSLFAFSSTSGIILETGDAVSQICAIVDGYSIPSSFIRSNFGGKDVSDYTRKLLKLKGVDLISDTEKLLLHEIKKKYLQCNLDKKKEDNIPTKYILPDLNSVQITDERYLATKVLLNPSLVGKNCLGLSQMIVTCVEKINSDLREKMSSTIRLTGGNSCFRGLNEVLHTEARSLLPKFNTKIKIKALNPSLSIISCWVGGNIIAGLDIFNNLLISKNDWNEKGKDIVHIQTF
jgi:actin-related protein